MLAEAARKDCNLLLSGDYCGFCGQALEGPLKMCKNCGNTMCEACLTEHEKNCGK